MARLTKSPAPQSGAPRRSTRATRSGSIQSSAQDPPKRTRREPTDPVAASLPSIPEASSRRSGRLIRPRSVTQTIPSRGKKATISASAAKSSQNDSNDEEEDDEEANTDGNSAVITQREAESPSNIEQAVDTLLSALSGATAVPYDADAEIEYIQKNSELLPDEIATLSKLSQNVLTPMIYAHENGDPTKLWESSKQIRLRAQMVVDQTAFFKTDREQFIHPHAVLQAMFNVASIDEIPYGAWRPEPLLRYANMALLVRRLFSIDPSNAEASTLLAHVDRQFCSLFHDSESIDEQGNRDAFHIALAIRTQYLIASLRSPSDDLTFDLESLIRMIFYQPDLKSERGWASDEFDHLERHWTEGVVDFSPELKSRLVEIRHLLKDPENNEEAASFIALHFSWHNFCMTLLNWIHTREDDLRAPLTNAGGGDQLAEALSVQVASHKRRAPREKGKSQTKPSSKAIERISASARRPRLTEPFKLNVMPKTEGRLVGKATAKNKTFIDAQRTASKVAPISQHVDDDDADEDAPGVPIEDSSSSGPSRAVTQDDGFQEQAAANEVLVERKCQEAKKKQSAGKRKAIEAHKSSKRARQAPQSELSATGATRNSSSTPALRAAPDEDFDPEADENNDIDENDDDDDDDDDDDADDDDEYQIAPSSNYAMIREKAQATQRSHSVSLKGPQIRTPWSHEENEALIRLIGEHGTSYANLKRKDEGGQNELRYRNPEQMRDRARNMKFDFLRAGGDPPENFDGVLLKPVQIEQLRVMGIHYIQGQHRATR